MDSKNSKNKNRLYQFFGIALLCFAIIMLTYNTTYSWFRDKSVTSNSPEVTIIGTIALDVTTNFKLDNLVFAPDTVYTTVASSGESLATRIKTSDKHDIDGAFVRVKFTSNRSELTLHFGSNVTTSSDYTNSATDENKWYYNSIDGFYYYIGTVSSTNITFNSGYAIDNTLYNAKESAPVELSFYVEGLQKQYGAYLEEWPTAPTIFKTYARQKTGY